MTFSPIERFNKMHSRHPDLAALKYAYSVGDLETYKKLHNQIARDGWKSYLETVKTSGTAPMFSYLAKVEGRKGKLSRYQCDAPLVSTVTGEMQFDAKAKVETLAEHFATKFSAQSQQGKVKSDGPGATKGAVGSKVAVRVHGTFQLIRQVEVRRAIHSMSSNRAPGPDDVQAELFKNTPCLLEPVRRLLNSIMVSGNFPRPMLQLYIVPLDKPGKDASSCKAKRPISLICVVSKILEAIVLARLTRLLGGGLDGAQFAYRRERGTELHLIRLYDSICSELENGRFVYLAAIDIDGAFDNVPHSSLVRT